MARIRPTLVSSLTAAVVAASLALGGEARAESMFDGPREDESSQREGLVAQLGMVYGAVRADEAKLHTLQSEPTPLSGKDLRLDGTGSMTGGMLAVHFITKGFRFGLVESFSGASGLKMLHAPLSDGYALEASAWRLAVELTFGHQFAVGKLSPYADVRVGYSMLNATVKLVDPDKGVLGSTNYTAWAPVIGPRIGVLFPVAKGVLLDLAVTYGLIGHDAVGLTMGVGFAPFGKLAP